MTAGISKLFVMTFCSYEVKCLEVFFIIDSIFEIPLASSKENINAPILMQKWCRYLIGIQAIKFNRY